MEINNISLKELSQKHAKHKLVFAKKLNPEKNDEMLSQYILDMFEFKNYTCFGLFQNDILIGMSSGWTTVRFYSGKQLELDNVIIESEMRSSGLGKSFLSLIENWAKDKCYQTIELNTYVQNGRSHKFYFNLGYHILGLHFQKHI